MNEEHEEREPLDPGAPPTQTPTKVPGEAPHVSPPNVHPDDGPSPSEAPVPPGGIPDNKLPPAGSGR